MSQPTDVELAVSPAGDALVVWTAGNDPTTTYQAVAAEAGQPAAFGAPGAIADAQGIRGAVTFKRRAARRAARSGG